MNTDERGLKTIALSAFISVQFISVHRRLNLLFPDFFSNLLKAGRNLNQDF
jgi:hypothetical protein